jgi:hypothetical protein
MPQIFEFRLSSAWRMLMQPVSMVTRVTLKPVVRHAGGEKGHEQR